MANLMSLCALHVLESSCPDAGSVAVCLGGLHSALASLDAQSKVVAPPSNETSILERVDVIHIHGWDYPLAHQMAAAALKTGKPYVIAPHGSLSYGPFHQPTWKERLRFVWQTRRLVRGAACLSALNPLEEKELQSQRLHPHVQLSPYGLSFDEYNATLPRKHPSADTKSLLLLGSLHPRGGCVALLKAIAEIGPDADGWNVVLAGADNAEWRKKLESAVRRKKGEDRVTFASAPTIAEQRDLLVRASLLVSPGLHIGLPVSIMQAVACGIPVIASTCTAPPGLDGAIQVFEPRREALRETLRSVLKLPEESRRALAEKARVAGRASLDWSVLANQYARLYKSIT